MASLSGYFQPKEWRIKGFVLRTQKSKNEDLIVTLLSPTNVQSYYRFYGARHSILHLGYLIDFEEKRDNPHFMPQIRSLRHIGNFSWLGNFNKLRLWQDFIGCFYIHLKEAESIESFYFDLLLEAALKWEKQNPKRVIIEAFCKLLHFEGRVDDSNNCFLCEKPLEEWVGVMRPFHMTHPHCSKESSYPKSKIQRLLQSQSTIELDDQSIEQLCTLALKGF